MATEQEAPAETGTADCGEPETKLDAQPQVTKLCMFAAPSSPSESLERTASYAKDPKAYLIDKLGQSVFDEQKHLLSLPESVDKDVYGTGSHKQHFEQHIAKLLGQDHGLFFFTGVQAQLDALKIHCERAKNRRVAWHISSHLESAEERSFDTLYGLERTLLGDDPEKNPAIHDIKQVLGLPEGHRPAAVLLEIPNRVLGCETYSFSDLEGISAACRNANVKLHCDGARIWEIEPFYQATAGKSFADIGALFDSIYVSFYKGLGGVTGAVLASKDESFIADAKMWQRRAGGNSFTVFTEVIDCERGFNENVGTMARKRQKMLEVVGAITSATEHFKNGDGQQIVNFIPNEPTCCQVRTMFKGYTTEQLYAARDKAQEKTGIRVLERCWPKLSLDETNEAKRAGKSDDEIATLQPDDKRHVIEWMIMSITEKIETKTFVDGYVALCDALVSAGG